MVKISNGVNTFEVTRGAFEGIYSKQGYILVPSKAKAKLADSGAATAKSDDELFLESITEKPLSQWSKEEVRRFAALNDIDITATKNANEAKAIIKDFLESMSGT